MGRRESQAGLEHPATKEILAGQALQAYQVRPFLPPQTQAHYDSRTDLPVRRGTVVSQVDLSPSCFCKRQGCGWFTVHTTLTSYGVCSCPSPLGKKLTYQSAKSSFAPQTNE